MICLSDFSSISTRSTLISKPASICHTVPHTIYHRVARYTVTSVKSTSRWWDFPESNNTDLRYHDEIITFVSKEGILRMEGRGTQNQKNRQRRRYREEDFMNPNQKLCLGALFSIAATNKLDMGRRICVLGFCRSVEMLSVVVQDTVEEQGGEIVVFEKQTSGLLEKLNLTVALPLLWGVPPTLDLLNDAIRSGGGIVDKVYNRWEFL